MEVESPNNLLEENNFYKLLYPNQNYKISLEYKQWKKSIEEKFGKNNNGNEIFCEDDNIIIYNKDANDSILCPLCRRMIYLCNYCNKIKNGITTNCCFRAYFKEIITDKEILYKYINKKEMKTEFYEIFGANFIPFVFIFQTLLISMFIFYLNLENEEGKTYDESMIKKSNIFNVFYGIFVIGYFLSMIIAFSIFFYFIYLIIVIISLPFK